MTVNCPNCKKGINIPKPDKMAGKTMNCRYCGVPFEVPKATTPAKAEEPAAPAPAPAPKEQPKEEKHEGGNKPQFDTW
jgi:hypothetical protein